MAFESFAEGDIFHEIDLRESADELEKRSGDEDGLVACSNTRQSRPPIHECFYKTKEDMVPGEFHVKPSPGLPIFHDSLEDDVIGVRREESVGVKKEKNITMGKVRAGIELSGATPWGLNDMVDEGLGQERGCVITPAVNEDNLMS